MTPRQLAIEVTKKLQAAGFQALWAGGCVRDSLLNTAPKDYDVATSATPDEVQELFGSKKTLPIGKSFGVITVIGPKSAGNIEIATFRRDGDYSDGRRPDSVEFTDAKEDAFRRDFTINGMFYDPISKEVIDYVDGEADLERKLIRSIGDADERIEEDRLRMLRGARFAATYGFDIEDATMRAIQKRAADIGDVSPERIGAELRRMLAHPGKGRALRLLIESNLWEQVLPTRFREVSGWDEKIPLLEKLEADFPTTLAAILRGTEIGAIDLQDAWRLTNEEISRSDWILKHERALSVAENLKWSELQPLLTSIHSAAALDLLQASDDAGLGSDGLRSSVRICLEKLELDQIELNPEPLVDGKDLMDLGMNPGPGFKAILNQVRQMQLDGQLLTREAARKWIVDTHDLK